MDSRCFDAMTRLAGTRLSRTAALRSLAAVALATVSSSGRPAHDTSARKKKKKSVCLCPTAQAAECTHKKARKQQARKLANQACNYSGKCQPGVVGAQCPRCLPPTADLQAAIDAASTGSTLVLCAGTWSVSSTVQIGRNLTMVGAGTGKSVLDGNDAVRVLRVGSGVTAAVRDLTITNGKASGFSSEDGGGGIFNEGTLSLRGVTVAGNRSEDAAGGINNLGGTLKLQDGSRVTGNKASNNGGGIENRGTLTLQAGSQVAGNSAGSGGGIFNADGTVTLQAGGLIGGDTAEEANSASGGAGIYTAGGTVTLETGSRVTGNSAVYRGGGIYTYNGVVTLQGGSRVSGNSATGSGGGIYSEQVLVTLEAGALVCSNTPANSQCAGAGVTGICPYPAETCGSA